MRTHTEANRLARVFLGADRRMRPIWRAVLFLPCLVAALVGATLLLQLAVPGLPWQEVEQAIQEGQPLTAALAPALALQYGLWVVVTLLVSWLFLRLADGTGFRALGLWFDARWARELLLGICIGAVLQGAVAGTLWGLGWVRYQGLAADLPAALASLGSLGLLLLLAAAWEEIFFRGYPFQRLVDSVGPLAAVLVFSALFGLGHIGNPSATPLATANTVLAGVLLAAAYLKTRALWLPIGLHWAWNFFMGPVLGLPVSGIRMGDPLLRAEASGPQWLSGGPYGPEGSVVLTVAAALATVWLWRTRRISSSPAAAQVIQ